MEALFLKASKLPRVDIERPEKAIGKTTVQSMQSCAVRGYVGALAGIITDIQEELSGGKSRRRGLHDGGIPAASGPHDGARGSQSQSMKTIRMPSLQERLADNIGSIESD